MWIFLNDAFVSAVQHDADATKLLVRARRKVDLERVFGKSAEITHTPAADYHWRTTVSRIDFQNILAEEVTRIDYRNFKNTVKENPRHDAYMDVWTAMYKFQGGRGMYDTMVYGNEAKGVVYDFDDETKPGTAKPATAAPDLARQLAPPPAKPNLPKPGDGLKKGGGK